MSEEFAMNIGTCGHIIGDEWYTDDRSSYYLKDTTGIVVYATTCKECWEKNNEAGLVGDAPVMDDFFPEVDNNTLPDVVFDSEGNAIRVTEETEEEEVLPLSSYFDNTK